jgi:hypothetical protein
MTWTPGIEMADRDVLLEHLRQTRGQDWISIGKPDYENRSDPSPDYRLIEESSGSEALLEVTSFGPPVEQITAQRTIEHIRREIEQWIDDRITGLFSLEVDMARVISDRAFSRSRRSGSVKLIAAWVLLNGPVLGVGEAGMISGVSGVKIRRFRHGGPFRMTGGSGIGGSGNLNQEHARLQSLLFKKARKFRDRDRSRRWLLVNAPGMPEHLAQFLLEIKRPTEIDEIFFVEYLLFDNEDSFRLNWSPYGRIIEYTDLADGSMEGTSSGESVIDFHGFLSN